MDFDGNFHKIADWNVQPLAARMSHVDWNARQRRQGIFPEHRQTKALCLVWDEDLRHCNTTVHPEYREFASDIEPALQLVRERFAGPGYFVRLLFALLPGGATITEHVDSAWSLRHCHRVHVPIVSHSSAILTVGGESRHLAPGEIWEINNNRRHGAVNSGDRERIHLIADWVSGEQAEAVPIPADAEIESLLRQLERDVAALGVDGEVVEPVGLLVSSLIQAWQAASGEEERSEPDRAVLATLLLRLGSALRALGLSEPLRSSVPARCLADLYRALAGLPDGMQEAR